MTLLAEPRDAALTPLTLFRARVTLFARHVTPGVTVPVTPPLDTVRTRVPIS